jgi:hypothetical protein
MEPGKEERPSSRLILGSGVAILAVFSLGERGRAAERGAPELVARAPEKGADPVAGKQGSQGVGGPAPNAQLDRPHGVFVDPRETLYIADSGNDRVVRVVQ